MVLCHYKYIVDQYPHKLGSHFLPFSKASNLMWRTESCTPPMPSLDSPWQKVRTTLQLTHLLLYKAMLIVHYGNFSLKAPKRVEFYVASVNVHTSSVAAKAHPVRSPRFLFYYSVMWLCCSLLWGCPISLSFCAFGNDVSYYHLILGGSWNCVFSKQFWAERPDLTVLSGFECITSTLQYIYYLQLFLSLLLKSSAVEVFMQTVS